MKNIITMKLKLPSLLALTNYVLQFFFIRIYVGIDDETKKATRWGILYWVVPLTGWWKGYKILGNTLHMRQII